MPAAISLAAPLIDTAECLDAADDLGQLRGRGIGVVTHLREHAAEVAAHACGEVAGGDGLQQGGERLQVAVGGGHQVVEAFHHQAEVVLEALGIAAGAEVAVGRRQCQVLDLGIHCTEIDLDLGHGLAEHGLFAGQSFHILGQVADRVAAHDLRQPQLHRDVRAHQRVGVVRHAAVLAGEGGGIDAEADLAIVVALGHVGLRGEQVAQLQLHLAHRLEQATTFVVESGVDVIIQFAAGNRFGCAGGPAQRLGEAAGDQHAQHAAQQHHQQRAADQQLARVVHGLQCDRRGLTSQLVLQGDVFGDLVLPLLHRRRGLGQQQGQRLVAVAGHDQIDDLVVQCLDHGAPAINFCADLTSLVRRWSRIQRFACLGVVGARRLDELDKLDIIFTAGGQHHVTDLRRNNGIGIHHGVGEADLLHVLMHQMVHQRARGSQAAVTDKGNEAG
ncbi:hypothetical protein XPR_2387 [Xanthomonas arboricola pv. pruni MAFF 301420]|uniref:Uncharacterized protein n=1 Tax=Xanthomonas arboricola pv. pruni MAFF 301420 TaxID=1418095 RepID=W4SHA0_9XANT|nr:hypothetical protein XPR_2387 [Xanthomonas arboricola pv. pruni MAFF 301420]